MSNFVEKFTTILSNNIKPEYQSRKLILFIVVWGYSAFALWFGKMTELTWVGLTEWLFGLYIVGNLGEQHIQNGGSLMSLVKGKDADTPQKN